MDNFEWERGYAERFGVVYNDFPTQTRTIKNSGFWLMNNCFTEWETEPYVTGNDNNKD